MKILAIDTSADETSVAITEGFRVLSSTISSQISSHAAWGGIVPSIARLAHEERIDFVVAETLRKARTHTPSTPNGVSPHQGGKERSVSAQSYTQEMGNASLGKLPTKEDEGVWSRSIPNIDCVAVTYGPGLSIALEVGIKKAKELAALWSKPLIAVNHMEGHMYSSYVQNSAGNPHREVVFPFLSLLISGGHTQIIKVTGNGEFEILGETVDDAAGEALDKAAKMLGLGYPGGPIIEKLSKDVKNIEIFKFPRPMVHDDTLKMSFSGLKTHLYYFLKGTKGHEVDMTKDLSFMASSFQEAVYDCIIRKMDKAIVQTGISRVAVGGGVSANKRLRNLMRGLARKRHGSVSFPAYRYLCGDNAAMIGVAAYMQAERGDYMKNIEALERVPRLRL